MNLASMIHLFYLPGRDNHLEEEMRTLPPEEGDLCMIQRAPGLAIRGRLGNGMSGMPFSTSTATPLGVLDVPPSGRAGRSEHTQKPAGKDYGTL